jgi:hypothetical protein
MYTAPIRSGGMPVSFDMRTFASRADTSRGARMGSSWSTSSGYFTWMSRTTVGQNEEISGYWPRYSARNISVAAVTSSQAGDRYSTSLKPNCFSAAEMTPGGTSSSNWA